jgi:hypothetical protein
MTASRPVEGASGAEADRQVPLMRRARGGVVDNVGGIERQRHGDGPSGPDAGHLEATAATDDTVDEQLPLCRQPVKIGEPLPVVDAQPIVAAVRPCHCHRTVDPSDFAHRRVWRAVGTDETIGDEVGVVGHVAELAAIGEAPATAGHTLQQPVVLPLPDEPALQSRCRLERRPVVGEAAVRVAHRVAVLAQDPRTGIVVGVDGADEIGDLRVHRRDQISDGVAALVARSCPGAHDRALVVQWARRVVGADPRRLCFVVDAVARLVAERPGDDRRMVLVAQHHPCSSFEPRRAVARVLADGVVEGVALDVCFVDHVQAELVAEIQEARIVRVVRAAHGIDVVLLHRHKIGAHVGDGDGFAALGMVVVAVDAADHHRLAVDQQLPIGDGDRAEADGVGNYFLHRARRIGQRHNQAVAVRLLGRPRLDVGDLGGDIDDVSGEDVRPQIDRN